MRSLGSGTMPMPMTQLQESIRLRSLSNLASTTWSFPTKAVYHDGKPCRITSSPSPWNTVNLHG